MHQVLIHIILVGLIFAVFIFATAGIINARGVKQQVFEKEVALLIDSAEAGMSFSIMKKNINGIVNSVEVRNGKIFIGVEGLGSVKGYPYFSKYSVRVKEEANKFVVRVG